MKKNVLMMFLMCFIGASQLFAQAPTITSFTAVNGKAGDVITINGTNFVDGTTTVKFGGADASGVLFVSATQIKATLGTVGNSGFVSATVAGQGTGISSATFQFNPTTANTSLSEADVVINKVYNADDTDGSGDAIEILVVKDHSDLRGLYIKDWQPKKNGGLLTFFFREIALFSDVRAGTLIVARNSGTSADVTFTDVNDFNLDLGLQDLNFFNAGNASNVSTNRFDIGGDDLITLQKGSPSGNGTGLIAMVGSGPTVSTLLPPLPANSSSFNTSLYTRLNGFDIATPGKFVYITNRNSSIADYKHVGAAANTPYVTANNQDRIKSNVTMNDDAVPVALALGTPSNAANLVYITALRLIGVTPLPVNLISFTAKQGTNGVELNWATASEQNNNRFEIQRSADGTSFVTIKTETGANNANTRNNYSYTDKNPLSGVNYYQLVQIDNNGTATNLGVQAVNSDLKGLAFSVASNSDANQINYSVYATVAGQANIKIFSTGGNQVASANVTLVAGENSLKLTANNLKSGVYVAVLTAENTTLTTKFVK